jgi:uncharacterized protein
MRRLAVAGLATLAVACSCTAQTVHHVDDRAGILDSTDVDRFEDYLALVDSESGVDIRFVFVDSLAGETLEQFAVRTARASGISQNLDRRGILFAYDVRGRRVRIEVGPTLQGIFPDAFIGYLVRDQLHSFFTARKYASLGLRRTMFLLTARLRRAALGNDYDPRPAAFIEDRRRLATGGGASGATDSAGALPFRSRLRGGTADRYFVPQPTVAGTYQRYLEWLARPDVPVDVPLFTHDTQVWLMGSPFTSGFTDFVLFLEYGMGYRVVERGDLAMLYFTDDPLNSPHFFRRTSAGWVMDILADVRHSREAVGGAWTWYLTTPDDDITRAFRDIYTKVTVLVRVAGGDNRPIPIHTYAVSPQLTRKGAGNVPGLERITAHEAAARIAAARGGPAVVLFYQWGNRKTREHFPQIVDLVRRCQTHSAQVLAFSVDEPFYAPSEIPGFLRDQHAPFPAIHIYPWLEGQFTEYMNPIGIRIGTSWGTPLMALIDKDGRVLAQAQSIAQQGPDLAVGDIETALATLH